MSVTDSTPERPVHERFIDPADLVRWVEGHPEEYRASTAQSIFDDLISRSVQAKGKGTNSCIKLCGLVDHCTRSQASELRDWAFAEDLSLRLFNFYIEWNEVEQHRAMRLILDVLPTLIEENPNGAVAVSLKTQVLDTLISIIGRKSTKPLLKSALKSLDHFTVKSLYTIRDIGESYRRVHSSESWESDLDLWADILAQLFLSMGIWYVRTVSGKYIVTLYRALRGEPAGSVAGRNGEEFSTETWLQWLQDALVLSPLLLDSMKNYVFLPLFKDDRADSLRLLQHMKTIDVVSTDSEEEIDVKSLLTFSALEIGKKVGIVEEPDQAPAQEQSAVYLDEALLDSVLAHPSSQARSLVLSLIISSNSTTRPFNASSLRLLKSHLPHLFADPSARFRMELLSKLKSLYKRARGAIPVLRRALHRLANAPADAKSSAKVKAPQGVPSLSTEVARTWSEERLQESLSDHREFLTWLVGFLKSELIPTASYQRHFSALRGALFVIRTELDESKVWETNEDDFPFFGLFEAGWVRALLDLTLDAFEDVRYTSTEILKIFFSDKRFANVIPAEGVEKVISAFLERIEELAKRTSRADHADGVARTYELLCRFYGGQGGRIHVLSDLVALLEGKLSFAEQDLGRAVLDAPAAGYFASLRYVWQATTEGTYTGAELEVLSDLQKRAVQCCQRIWTAVKHVLCDDSPEGHMPQELEDLEGLDTKDLLSYSFRSVHEASNFMRTMLSSLRSKPQTGKLRPSVDVFADVGNLTFDQLTNLRHRGAFTTVSLTFATCCQLVKHLDAMPCELPAGQTFLDVWYKGSIDCILTHASTTRRSAGIPSMITGILSANPQSPSFEKVMADLIGIAGKEARITETDGSNLPQVHALNCLKDIFKSSHLAQMGKVESHIPPGLELAAGCLKSEVWAIRNSGLLLLRSLMDGLFGTSDSKTAIDAGWDGKTTRLYYHQYPILPVVLFNLLKSGHGVMKPSTGAQAAEAVFPALDIIRRGGPPEALREELYVLVVGYLGSPVWHVRDMAARALCSFHLRDDWIVAIRSIVYPETEGAGFLQANRLHGVFLTIKYVFEKVTTLMPEVARRDTPHLLDLIVVLYNKAADVIDRCSEAQAAYVEILNIITGFQIQSQKSSGILTAEPKLEKSLEANSPDASHHALLDAQLAVQRVHYAYESADMSYLTTKAVETALAKPEAAVDMLETIPTVFGRQRSPAVAASLCELYVAVCNTCSAVEPRTVAIENLAEEMDYLLSEEAAGSSSSDSELTKLWVDSLGKSMNPGLSNAIIRLSGPVMATILSRHAAGPSLQNLEDLQKWSVMMADAIHEDRPFDTRFSASQALKSFFVACPFILDPADAVHHSAATKANSSYLPILLTLYDALNDDDDEVRDLAAAAARPLLANQSLLPLEAADRLLVRLTDRFGRAPEFRALVMARTVGAVSTGQSLAAAAMPIAWVPAAQQLEQALWFDDALFAVEDQNLYIDEVRESKRWSAGALKTLATDSAGAGTEEYEPLNRWASDGLQALIEYALGHEDKAGGWTSLPNVYAVCARVILCGAALVKSGADTDGEVRRKLEELRRVGEEKRLHGLLLELVEF